MTTRLSEEQVMIQDMAKRFASDRLAPFTSQWDREKHFPVDVIKDTAELGFAGIYVGEDVGGSALGRLDAALILDRCSDTWRKRRPWCGAKAAVYSSQ